MTAQIPIDHHFTPVFYLTSWAVDGRVIRYSRPRDVVVAKSNAPSRTGSAEHLYTLSGVPPERQAAIETDFFQPVDDRAARAYAVLIEKGLAALTWEQRVDWTRFMMSMQHRSPFSLGEVERLAEKVMRSAMQVQDSEFAAGMGRRDPTSYDWIMQHEPHIIANFHKMILPNLIDSSNTGGYLAKMHWAIADLSGSKHSLLTSDRPFTWSRGWKDPRTVLTFPLSPHQALIATNSELGTQSLLKHDSTRLAATINDQVARLAVDFVIGRDKSHLAFVEKRLRQIGAEPVPGPGGKGRPGMPG